MRVGRSSRTCTFRGEGIWIVSGVYVLDIDISSAALPLLWDFCCCSACKMSFIFRTGTARNSRPVSVSWNSKRGPVPFWNSWSQSMCMISHVVWIRECCWRIAIPWIAKIKTTRWESPSLEYIIYDHVADIIHKYHQKLRILWRQDGAIWRLTWQQSAKTFCQI